MICLSFHSGSFIQLFEAIKPLGLLDHLTLTTEIHEMSI